MVDEKLEFFEKAVEEFQKMIANAEVNMDVVSDLDKAVFVLLEEPRLIPKAKEYLDELNPYIRTIVLTHLFRNDLFRSLYTGEMSIEEYERMRQEVANIMEEAINNFLSIFKGNTAQKTGNNDIKIPHAVTDKVVPTEESIEFYEELAKEYREKYGTDNPEELRRIAKETGNLHAEMVADDMEMYRALTKKLKK